MDELQNAEYLLMQEVLKDVDMNSLVNISAKLLDNPIAFYLLSMTELVYSYNYPKEAAEDFINCRLKSTKEEKEKWTEIFKESIGTCKPSIQSWPYQRYRQLVCGSRVHGSLVGYITMPQVNRPLEEIDMKLVEFVAGIYGVALHIQEDSHLKGSETSLLWGLLTDNINADYLQRNILNPAFGSLKEYRMLWFLRHTAEGNLLTDMDVNELLHCLKKKWFVFFEEGYAVIINGINEKEWELLSAAAEKKEILIGVSDIFSNIKDTKMNFRNAQYALRYAGIRKINSGIAKFDNFKLSHLISMAKEHLDLSTFALNCIDEIEQYDIKNHSEYLNTLRTFLQSNRDIDEMSKTLFVHKNTVLYRIKRLEELFHINLHDGYQNASLVCSLLIHDNLI